MTWYRLDSVPLNCVAEPQCNGLWRLTLGESIGFRCGWRVVLQAGLVVGGRRIGHLTIRDSRVFTVFSPCPVRIQEERPGGGLSAENRPRWPLSLDFPHQGSVGNTFLLIIPLVCYIWLWQSKATDPISWSCFSMLAGSLQHWFIELPFSRTLKRQTTSVNIFIPPTLETKPVKWLPNLTPF